MLSHNAAGNNELEFDASSREPPIRDSRWSSGLDPNIRHTSSKSRTYPSASRHNRDQATFISKETWQNQYIQELSNDVSNKRSRDLAAMENNPQKRHRGLHPPNLMPASIQHPNNSKLIGHHEHEVAWDDGCDEEDKNEQDFGLGLRAYQPTGHMINAVQSRLPPPAARHRHPTGMQTYLGSGKRYWATPTQVSRSTQIMGPEEQRELRNVRQSSRCKPTSSEKSQPQELMATILRSPLWASPLEFRPSNCGRLGGSLQDDIVHDKNIRQLRSTTPQFDFVLPHTLANQRAGARLTITAPDRETRGPGLEGDSVALGAQMQYAIPTGIPRDPEDISKKIRDGISMNGSETMATPTNIDRICSTRGRTTCPQLPQGQPAYQELESILEENNALDSTPIEHVLERSRRPRNHSRANINDSPYRASTVLPYNSICYNDRPKTKAVMPKIQQWGQCYEGSPTSPIEENTPPESPVNALFMKNSIPMKQRLSPPTSMANSIAKTDPANEKQRRAAEIIIKKELEARDKEIFGDIIGDSLEVNRQKGEFSRVEAQRKRNEEKRLQLIKAEIERTAELKEKNRREEAAERKRRQREQENERKRAKREAERKKQMAIDESTKEELRSKAQEQIEASRRKAIADNERGEQEKQKTISIQLETAKRTEMELRREIARLQATSLKAATVIPSESKKPIDTIVNACEEEDSLFLPETNGSSNKVQNSNHGSIYDMEQAGARSFKPKNSAEFFAKDRNFQSRSQKDGVAFDAKSKVIKMNKRLEALLNKPAAKDSSEINPVFDLKRDIIQNEQNSMKSQRTRRKNEARRRKHGEKARNSYRQRLLKEAEEGGYTINDDEMNKRLDSYMKKREDNYQKQKAKRSFDLETPSLNPAVGPEWDSSVQIHTPVAIGAGAPGELEATNDGDPSLDPEQQARMQNEMYMREALTALGRTRTRGVRFAQTAAKRTVNALQSESTDESDESEDDPDDDPTFESFLDANKLQNQEMCTNGNEGEDKTSGQVELPNLAKATVANALDSEVSPFSIPLEESTAGMLASLDTNSYHSPVIESQSQPNPHNNNIVQPKGAENDVTPVYVVKILRTVNGEGQAPQALQKFLNHSEANTFAEDTVKECRSNNSTSEYIEQLFHGLVVQDVDTSIRVWVESEIECSSKLANVDLVMVNPGFLASSWLIHFVTVKDTFNEESQICSTQSTSTILPGHNYSDIEGANHAACNYITQFLKPKKPVIEHVQQYEKEFIPEITGARDIYCKQKKPFSCGLERDETQFQWLAEKEVSIDVIRYGC